ncbi:MAG TPA: recombinase family protein [Vicinamibacterales bacterium]|nr:recombinase family protein [Vicinamibacterales bacterium]
MRRPLLAANAACPTRRIDLRCRPWSARCLRSRQHEGADREPQPADATTRVRDYCRLQGYEILERFHEEGESAKSTDRSQLQNLNTYCRVNKGRVHFVVVFNLTRFARDKYDHFALRSHLQSLDISLRSATEPIDDTSTGKLMEGVLAAFAQFDNDSRSD